MDILTLIEQIMKEHTVLGSGVILFIILQLIEIAPIKLSPWSAIRTSVSNFLTAGIKVELNNLSTEIKSLDNKLNKHIEESIEKDIRDRRSLILRSAAAISNGQYYNDEHLEFLVSECDAYKQYCRDYNIHNGVASANMEIIYQAYKASLLNKVDS